MPGPVPNRSDDLARPRERGQGEAAPVITRGELRPTSIPRADPEWHPTARKIWNGMKSSGQAAFYQDSDWAVAYFLMGEITDYLKSTRGKSSMMLASIMSALTGLCLTEGERRRARIELEAPKEETNAQVTAIDGYKKKLGLA